METELVGDHLSIGTNQLGTNWGGPYGFGTKCVTATFWILHTNFNDEILFFSGGRKTAGAPSAKAAPAPKQSPTVAGKAPLKVSDEITIIPQGKNTQAKPKVPVLVSLIW